jgi:ribosome-associated protein
VPGLLWTHGRAHLPALRTRALCRAGRRSPIDLLVTPDLTIPEAELRWRFSRSSGPGGQHVNTSDSRVQLTWGVVESAVLTDEQRERLGVASFTVTVSEQRSQLRNRERALETLASRVRNALAPPPPPRRATEPTKGSKRRTAAAKQQRSATKQQRQRPTSE